MIMYAVGVPKGPFINLSLSDILNMRNYLLDRFDYIRILTDVSTAWLCGDTRQI